MQNEQGDWFEFYCNHPFCASDNKTLSSYILSQSSQVVVKLLLTNPCMSHCAAGCERKLDHDNNVDSTIYSLVGYWSNLSTFLLHSLNIIKHFKDSFYNSSQWLV